jgi:NhaP-type Na+/H+ or K+/H+ antiporter
MSTNTAWAAGAGLLFVAGAACFVGAATHHYADAGFVVNLMYEFLGAVCGGLALVIVLGLLVAWLRRRRRRPQWAETGPDRQTRSP